MPVLPNGVLRHVPAFRITCDGTPLPATADLIELETTHGIDGTGSVRLCFAAPPEDRGPDSVFVAAPLGARLEVALGYHDHLHPVFTGSVQAHRLLLASGGAPQRVLEAISSSAPAKAEDGIAVTAQYGATLLALDIERAHADLRERSDRAPVVQGHASLVGTTEVRPGRLLRLAGTGDAFDGCLCITGVQHRFSYAGWTTRVALRAAPAPV